MPLMPRLVWFKQQVPGGSGLQSKALSPRLHQQLLHCIVADEWYTRPSQSRRLASAQETDKHRTEADVLH